MRSEMRNLLIKRYGLAIIFIFLIAKIVTFSLNYITEEAVFYFTPDTSAYEKYTSIYEGRYSTEKGEQIESLIKRSSGASQMIGMAYSELNSGNATYEEYCLTVDKYASLAAEYHKGVQQFSEQVNYVAEDPEHRYILDTRGWICLLRNNGLDLLLVLMTIIISAPTFSNEYSTDMYQLLLTSPWGRKRLSSRKCVCSIVACGVAALLFCAVESCIVAVKIGLPCPTAPIQSLKPLDDSPYNISLISALLFTVLCKMIGAMMLSSVVLLLSTAIKRILPVVSIGVSAILIPYVVLSEANDRMYALPLGLLLPNGYLKGAETVCDEMGALIQLGGIPIYMTMIILVAAILLISVFCIWTGNLYVTGNLFGRRKK